MPNKTLLRVVCDNYILQDDQLASLGFSRVLIRNHDVLLLPPQTMKARTLHIVKALFCLHGVRARVRLSTDGYQRPALLLRLEKPYAKGYVLKNPDKVIRPLLQKTAEVLRFAKTHWDAIQKFDDIFFTRGFPAFDNARDRTWFLNSCLNKKPGVLAVDKERVYTCRGCFRKTGVGLYKAFGHQLQCVEPENYLNCRVG
jgi:hypothetical protein